MRALLIQFFKPPALALTILYLFCAAWNSNLRAAGPAHPRLPSTENCLEHSKSAVVGTIKSAEISEFYESDGKTEQNPMEKIHCVLAVEETIYGDDVGKTIALELKAPLNLTLWKPEIGQHVLVYVCDPMSSPIGIGNIFFAVELGTDYKTGQFDEKVKKQTVDSLRSIGKVWAMKSVADQAKAVMQGCNFADNPEFRSWCMGVLAGKTLAWHEHIADYPQLSKIRNEIGVANAYKKLREICKASKDDYDGAMYCDYLLDDDPEYKHSNQRYDLLWGLTTHCFDNKEIEPRDRFTSIVDGHLSQLFPERADDCIDRLSKLASDAEWSLRDDALITMRGFFSSANESSRDKAMDMMERYLKDDDPKLSWAAAFALGGLARADANNKGKVPDRIKRIFNSADSLPKSIRYLLTGARDEVQEILSKPTSEHSKSN